MSMFVADCGRFSDRVEVVGSLEILFGLFAHEHRIVSSTVLANIAN